MEENTNSPMILYDDCKKGLPKYCKNRFNETSRHGNIMFIDPREIQKECLKISLGINRNILK